MYFTSLHGPRDIGLPRLSGAPTECRQATKSASSAVMAASAERPIRVMILILTTTYGSR